MRALITAIIIFIWLMLGWYYKTTYEGCCLFSEVSSGTEISKESDASPPRNHKSFSGPSITSLAPLTFNWNSSEAVLNEGWEAYKNNLLNSLGEEDLLQITGQFRKEEDNNSSYENLGLARAYQVKNLFNELPDERIDIQSTVLNDDLNERNSNFESVRLRTIRPEKVIVKTKESATIYFPYSSTKRLEDPLIEAYLQDIEKRVKASGEQILLVGHTDSTSSSAFNQRLGLKRAHILRDYLLSIGVNKDQILCRSEGENQPIADNGTKAGRAKNRRTELKIISSLKEN